MVAITEARGSSEVNSQLRLDEVEIFNTDRYEANGYPFADWALLRRESPVHWCDHNAGVPFWAITKHEDITLIGRNPDQFLNQPMIVLPSDPEDVGVRPPETLLSMDNPKHRLHRRLIIDRFTPKALRRIHPEIEAIAKQIVESLLAEGDEGECDFVEKVAAPLPLAVIAWLLGVPREDWELLFDWTNRTLGAGDPEYRKEGEDSATTAQAAIGELFGYLAKLIEKRQKNPSDDLISLFANAEVDGKKLDRMEILGWCGLIVAAGNETTRNGISGGMLALIEHQDQLRKLQQEPGLLKSGTEEMVRWTSPIIHFARTAATDCEIRGQRIEKGQHLALFYPSANRDEDVFEDPEVFRVDRRPNRHIGFGVGEHFCAGAHLARFEMEMVFRHLLPRIEEIELVGPPVRLRSTFVGGIKRLPIRYRLTAA